MGVSSSYQLPPHFQEFTTWPAQRVSSCIKAHTDGEYDIGIDHTVVMALTGRGVDESKVTLLALSKGESHVINAYVFLLCVIMLGEPNRRIEHCQLGMVFDLFDFTSQMQVTMDEFAIMLLCLAQTCGSILSRQAETPKDSVIIEISKELFILAGKEGKGAVITKQEVMYLANDHFTSHGINTLDQVFDRLTLGKGCLVWKTEEDEEGAKK